MKDTAPQLGMNSNFSSVLPCPECGIIVISTKSKGLPVLLYREEDLELDITCCDTIRSNEDPCAWCGLVAYYDFSKQDVDRPKHGIDEKWASEHKTPAIEDECE